MDSSAGKCFAVKLWTNFAAVEDKGKMNVQISAVADDPKPAVQVKSNSDAHQSTRGINYKQDRLCTLQCG